MAVFRSIVQALMLPMLDTGHDLSFCGTVAREFVRDHHPRRDALLPEQLSQQAFGRLCIAAALDQDVEHDAVLIDGSPEPMLLARDADHDLIKVPLVSGCRKTPADLVGKALTEFQRPPTYGLVADEDAADRQHLLDHAQAQGKRKYNQSAWLITSAGKR